MRWKARTRSSGGGAFEFSIMSSRALAGIWIGWRGIRHEVAADRQLGARTVTAGQALDGPHANDSIKLPLGGITLANRMNTFVVRAPWWAASEANKLTIATSPNFDVDV